MIDKGLRRPLKVGFGSDLEKGFTDLFEGAAQAGVSGFTLYGSSPFDLMQFALNLDLNGGDPIGFGIPAFTVHDGRRVTAAGAFLTDKPNNLKIVTNALVTRILFHCNRAIGIECAGESCKPSPAVFVVMESLCRLGLT